MEFFIGIGEYDSDGLNSPECLSLGFAPVIFGRVQFKKLLRKCIGLWSGDRLMNIGRESLNIIFSGRLTARGQRPGAARSEEHTSELQSRPQLVCRLLLEKKN